MVRRALILIALCTPAFAYNLAQISVHETPIFEKPDEKSKVIQYAQKGEKLRLHPAEIFKDPYKSSMNLDPDLAERKLKEILENERDPLFKDNPPYEPDRHSKFYKLNDKLGNDAWILKDHVFVLYEDKREFDQKVTKPDPTDYVIPDPLPENYPLQPPALYRSAFTLGQGPNTRTSYPYTLQVQDQGYQSDISLDVTWVRMVKWDKLQKTFFGVNFGVHTGTSHYAFSKGLATENFTLITFGPRLEYDLWRRHKFRLNVNGTIQASLMDEITIDISSKSKSYANDKRSFSSFQLMPTFGANIQREELIGKADFLLGFNLHFHGNNTYASNNGGVEEKWWNGDDYDVPMHVGMSLFVGLQASN